MHHEHKQKNETSHWHHHACGGDLHLWHADGNTLNIPWWLIITALNIGLWWWHPLLLVLIGSVAVAWMLGYRVGHRKSKH